MEYMKAGEFKSKCLKVMDRVKKTRSCIVITKRNVPVVQIVPVTESKRKSAFGLLKGNIQIKGDIISPLDEVWDANS